VAEELQAEAGRKILACTVGHGSLLFAPAGLALCRNVQEGSEIRMEQPLMRLPRLS
jgi:hypothetical protein